MYFMDLAEWAVDPHVSNDIRTLPMRAFRLDIRLRSLFMSMYQESGGIKGESI